MKSNSLTISILFSFVLIFFSCKKDEVPFAKPTINLTELGFNNSSEATVGADLHVEADVIAEGTISTITIEIHSEFGGNWEYDSVFTEFSGLKNTNFHKHVEIPATADTGDYHFHFKVTDQEGQQTEIEGELKIVAATDKVVPVITITNAPTTNQVFLTGNNLTIEGTVQDNLALGGIYIGLIRNAQNLSDSLVDATNSITLLHTHDFVNLTNYSFNASINLGAALDNNNPPKDLTLGSWWQPTTYYLVVKCIDASGNWAFSAHYPIVLNN